MIDIGTHLLIVEANAALRIPLQKFLTRHGFLTSGARDGGHARRLLDGLAFDLIVLDCVLPGEDGHALCVDIRADRTTPLLVLVEGPAAQDAQVWLDAGADEIMAKPFEPNALLARINALLHRMPKPRAAADLPKVLHLGPMRYDLERGEMWQGARAVRLTATEAVLMRIFSGKPNQAISRTDLVGRLNQDRGAGGATVLDRAVDVQITRLRRKIEVDPKQPRYLQTIRGAGYMLSPD